MSHHGSSRAKNSLRLLAMLCMAVFAVIMSASSALAQGVAGADRILTPGVPVSGALNAQNVAQVYTFQGAAGDVVNLTAVNADGQGLALLLTNSVGQNVAQVSSVDIPGTVTMPAVTLPESGIFYVTVLSAGGVNSVATTEMPYQLTLNIASASLNATATAIASITPSAPLPTATAPTIPVTPIFPTATSIVPVAPTIIAPPVQGTPGVTTINPGQVLTSSGLQVTLTWNTTADMDLEVRDPVGGSLYWSTPTVASGGSFGPNFNGSCETVTANSPTENATWPAGAVPTGSYEVLVYYQSECAAEGAVTFTVNALVDGVALAPVEGTLLPGQVFLTSFRVNPDGSGLAGLNGVNDDVLFQTPTQELLANSQPIALNTPLTGVITSAQPFASYSFVGAANDVVTIELDATSGSLDTLLLLLDVNGNIIDSNDDDPDGGTTDSAIRNRVLANEGLYTVVATRYGQTLGGTEGDFTITLTGAVNTPVDLGLNLPNGTIEISLLWNTNADLQLLVRDPQGDSVFDDTPSVPSGGTLASQGNVNCNIVADSSPVSYVYWPEGRLPAGSYEVEVWYQNDCGDTSPVVFTLNVIINGQRVFSDTRQPNPDERYLTSFTVGVDGQVRTSAGGFIGDGQSLNVNSLDYQAQLENATIIAAGETATGSITLDNKFGLYLFSGQAGDVVSISMEATAGNLDTTLFVIDPNGFQIAENDDAVVGETTDSLVNNLTLPEDGQYIVIATHFGALYGASTGVYNLTLSQLN